MRQLKNKIYITLKSDTPEEQVDEIRAKLLGDLKILIKRHRPRNKDMVRYTVKKTKGKYRIVFAFTIPANYKGFTLRDNDRKILEYSLGLTPEQIKRVQEVLDD